MTQSIAAETSSRANCVADKAQRGYVQQGSSARKQRIVDEQRRLEIGERIKRFRGQMRQHQAAERLNVSVRTFQGWELGESATDLDNYERLAKLFGVSVSDILGTESGEPIWVQEIKDRQTEILDRLDLLEALLTADAIGQLDDEDDQPSAEGSAAVADL